MKDRFHLRTDTIETFLRSLSARVPAPGGGASGGLLAAQAAAPIAMVARYSDGEKYAGHRDAITAVVATAEDLRDLALTLSEQDVVALVQADRVPARVVAVADQIVGLAEQLLPTGNRDVISDVAAADAARAAASTERINVEINLAGITDAEARGDLIAAIATVDDITARAAQ